MVFVALHCVLRAAVGLCAFAANLMATAIAFLFSRSSVSFLSSHDAREPPSGDYIKLDDSITGTAYVERERREGERAREMKGGKKKQGKEGARAMSSDTSLRDISLRGKLSLPLTEFASGI